VRYGLVSREQAENAYGVVLTAENLPDEAASVTLRQKAKEKRGEPPAFDFGYSPPDRQAS
jgi:N-methylhydantoinase B